MQFGQGSPGRHGGNRRPLVVVLKPWQEELAVPIPPGAGGGAETV